MARTQALFFSKSGNITEKQKKNGNKLTQPHIFFDFLRFSFIFKF